MTVVTCGRAELPRAWGARVFRRPQGALHDHLIWGVEQGRLLAITGSEVRLMPQASALWVHGGDESHFSLAEDCRQAVVWYCRLRFAPDLRLAETLRVIEDLAGEVMALVGVCIRSAADELQRLRQRCQAAALLAHLAEHAEQPSGGLRHRQRERCLAYIQKHLTRTITLAEIAGHCGLSPSYFSRAFRRSMGCSLRSYLKAARVRATQSLLRETMLPLAELAEQLGYNDAFHLSRQFREVTGCAPSSWRQGL
jgi:AraC-like DNA-binding protein